MRKLLLVILWLPLATSSLILSLFLLYTTTRVKSGANLLAVQAKELLPKNGYQFYAALPEVLGAFTAAVVKEDARPEILRQYLRQLNSPLEPYVETIVAASDARDVDFRLITAIAGCESTFGKFMPEGSHNAFGYAIYTGQNSGAVFNDWEHAISTMAEYLATKYYSQGLTTPEEIGPIYAPPSVNTGNSWAKCVRGFMDELQ